MFSLVQITIHLQNRPPTHCQTFFHYNNNNNNNNNPAARPPPPEPEPMSEKVDIVASTTKRQLIH